MNIESKKWMELAKAVIERPFFKYECPVCIEDDSYVNITIVPWPSLEEKIDIHLTCQKCGCNNVITKAIQTSN